MSVPDANWERPARRDGFPPLRDYAVTADDRTCALIGLDGAVDWWALPKIDDAPSFGGLLDPNRGGRLVMHPCGGFEARQCYAGDAGCSRPSSAPPRSGST